MVVMKELLIIVRNSAAQLEVMLQDEGFVQAHELATKVLRSLDEVLSVVMTTPFSPTDSCEVSQNPTIALGSPSYGDRSCVDSIVSDKRPAVKDRRGGYKRRRALESHIRVSNIMDDGYAWRKYGQKVIMNSKYPRCYYRCTHKPDQGCLANKQVQIIGECPTKFQITYFGRHTCINITKKPSDFTVDSNNDDPCLISFASKSSIISTEQKYDLTLIEKLTPPNKEYVKEEASSDPIVDAGLTFCSDDLMTYTEEVLPELCSYDGQTSFYGDFGVEFLMECSDFDKLFSSR